MNITDFIKTNGRSAGLSDSTINNIIKIVTRTSPRKVEAKDSESFAMYLINYSVSKQIEQLCVNDEEQNIKDIDRE